MIIPIELRFKADKDSKSAFRTDKTIKSHDVNSVEFHISLDGLELTGSHTAKILSVFHSSKRQVNVGCEIVEGKIIYKPDTNLISRREHVTNYVYVYHNNQSLDVREFIYTVDLSKIDETSLEVKEVYDQSYADLLADFEQALNDYKDNLPQADSVRADIDEMLNHFSEDSQAKLSQYDADAQQAIADNQTAFGLAETGRQDNYEQAEDNRNRASNQAVVDWEQGAEALVDSKLIEMQTDAGTLINGAIDDFNMRGDAEIADWRESADVELEDYLADRVVLKNLIVNGDFSEGLTGWKLVNVRYDSENNFTYTGNLGYVYQNISAREDDKVYIVYNGAMVSVDGVLSVRLATSTQGTNYPASQVVVSGSGGESITGSAVINVQDNYEIIGFASYPSPGASRFVELNVLQAFNLTQTFGAGNEPTKSEMDELIKITGYFDEITLTKMQLLTWQLNLMRQNRNALIALGGTII